MMHMTDSDDGNLDSQSQSVKRMRQELDSVEYERSLKLEKTSDSSLLAHSLNTDALHLLNQKNEVSRFILLTYDIFNSPETSNCCGWGDEQGTTVVIHDVATFQNTVLPKFFKHQNYQSFVRQLNLYGFHKTEKDPSRNVFKHSFFQKGREDLLPFIKRKGNAAGFDRRSSDSMRKNFTEDAWSSSSQLFEQRLQLLESALLQSNRDSKLMWEHILSQAESQRKMQTKLEKIIEIVTQVFSTSSTPNFASIDHNQPTHEPHRNQPTLQLQPSDPNQPKIDPFISQRSATSTDSSMLNMLFHLTGSTIERPLQVQHSSLPSQTYPFSHGNHFMNFPNELALYSQTEPSSSKPPHTLSSGSDTVPTSSAHLVHIKDSPTHGMMKNEDSFRALNILNSIATNKPPSMGNMPTPPPWPTYNTQPMFSSGSSLSPLAHIGQHYLPGQVQFPSAQSNTDGFAEGNNHSIIRTITQMANQERQSVSKIEKLEELLETFVRKMNNNMSAEPGKQS